MSLATALNLAIALVEEHPGKVRGFMRGLPLEETAGLAACMTRLEQAIGHKVKREVCQELLDLEKVSCRIEAPEDTPECVNCFFQGLKTLEDVIEERLLELRTELGEETENEDALKVPLP